MSEITKDTWKLGEHEFSSRFILGSGKYSLELIDAAVKEAKAEIVTMAALPAQMRVVWLIS